MIINGEKILLKAIIKVYDVNKPISVSTGLDPGVEKRESLGLRFLTRSQVFLFLFQSKEE